MIFTPRTSKNSQYIDAIARHGMIRLSNGHCFTYLAASGALAFDGKGWPWEQPLRLTGLLDPTLFTVVTKTFTYLPREGNLRMYAPWRCVRLIKEGVVNAIGLTNPGFRWWCTEVGPRADRAKIPLVVSIRSERIEELTEMASALHQFDIVGLELNASCPNSEKELMTDPHFIRKACEAITHATPGLPLSVKLARVDTLNEIVRAAEQYVEFFEINSVPWAEVFPNKESPLKRLGGGGVSGKAAQTHTWKVYEDISRMTEKPVVAPSIWNYDDLLEMEKRGAHAFGFGSIFLRYPTRPTRYVRRMMASQSLK